MSKKLCSILLAFAMIMLTITNAFAAVQFENVDGSTFKIENLKELGFINGYEDGSLRLDQYIKRSEFAKVLVNAFDKEQEAEAIKGKFKPFKDVDESHWANGIISIVKNLKGINNTQIINGYPDGTFRPEEHITNAEALKMLVCCVKVDLTEEMYKNAEWFESWVKWAIELGIIGAESDVPNIVDMNAKVTRGNVFTMFYNAFEEDEVERPIEKTEEKEPQKKTDDKKEEKSVTPDRHAGSRHDRYDRYPEYPYYPDLPIVPFEPSVPEVKTYTISIDSSANGIVSADKYSAEEGEIVNLRIMPNEGYKLDTLEVKDEFGNKVQLVNQWFAMPSSNVVVSAKFVEETVKPVEFDKENIKNIEIKSEPTKMNYVEGEKLDLSGFVVTLTDINDNTVEVTYNDFLEYGIDVEPVDGTVLRLEDNGEQITVSKSGIEAKTNQIEVKEIEYNDDLFASLEIISEPENLTYNEGDSLKLNGLKVKLTDKNGKIKEVELQDFATNGITTEPTNEATLSLENNGKAISGTKSSKTVETTKKLEITELQYNDDLFESLEIISEPTNLSYKEKDKLDLTGLKVRLTDSNEKTKEVALKDFAANGITTEPANGVELKTTDNGKAITVKKGEKTATTTGKLEITELTYDDTKFAKLEIIDEPENLSYKEKDKLDLTGLKVKLTDKNDKSKVVELKDFAANGITTEPANGVELKTTDNGNAITVKKGEKTATTTGKLEITELTYDDTKFAKLEIIDEPEKLSYKENDKLDLTGLKVRLTDSNEKTKEVELKDFANYKITTEPANEATLSLADKGKAISVKKGETTATTKNTIEIIVFNPNKIVNIKVKNQPNKMVYDEGMALDLDGMVITLTDENGLTKDVEFARGAGTEYSKYIKTSIEDRNILGEEHNEKFIIVSLNQNPNIKTQTEILIVKHYFTIKYRGIWIAGFMNIPDDGLQEKVEEGSLWEYPSNEGKKITLDRTGFEFIGWQTEDGREIKTPFRPSKDMVMVAKWRDKNQPIMEYLKEQFETAAKLSTSIVKDKNKESLGLEYNEKVITIVPAKMEAFNIAEYNLINELQKLVKENFLTGYTINSKIRELNSSLTENQMLEYLIRDFASIANVNVSGLDYSNKSQVSDKVKEILTTLANSEKTVEITVNLAKDDVNTIDVYKFVFLKYKDMSASEVESTNNFYNDLMKNTVNSVNQQGIWENDPNNPDASVKVPVFKTEYDGNENVYTININTRYTDLLAKQTGGTGFKTAVVNFLTGGHVGKNGKVQNNLQKVKITQIGTEKSVIVDREQLNEIVHVNLGNMKSLLAPFSYIFMPEGKDVNTLSLQDLVGQEATFEYTYVNENYETYTVVRTVKFDTFTE